MPSRGCLPVAAQKLHLNTEVYSSNHNLPLIVYNKGLCH